MLALLCVAACAAVAAGCGDSGSSEQAPQPASESGAPPSPSPPPSLSQPSEEFEANRALLQETVGATDSEITRACAFLRNNGYDYWALGENQRVSELAGGRTLEVAAGIHQLYPGPANTRVFCLLWQDATG